MKKRFLPLLLCLVLLLSACGGTASGAGEPETGPLREPTTDLNVYVADYYYNQYLSILIREFKKSHPDVELNIVSVLWGAEEEGQKLPAELAAGRGPDLYVGYGYEFKDFYKVLNTGAFCDLTPYLENMESFDRSNYVEGVIDGGIYREKQYYIPLTWEYPGLVTTQEALDDAGISTGELGTFSGLMRAAQKYGAANDGADAFFMKDAATEFFLYYADGVRLDYETLRADVDTAEFREMIDAYKLIYAQDWTGTYDGSRSSTSGLSAYFLRNRKHLFTNEYMSSLGQTFISPIYIGEEFCFLAENETPLLLPIPTVDGKTLAKVDVFAAINTNSKNKANAADFLELLLQKDIQHQMSKYTNPVFRELLEERAKSLLRHPKAGTGYGDTLGRGSTITNIRKEDADQMLSALFHVDGVVRHPQVVIDIVFKDMEPYFKDEQSYETCLQKLQSDLTIYISE